MDTAEFLPPQQAESLRFRQEMTRSTEKDHFLSQIVDQASDGLYSYAMVLSRDRDEAQDLVQETCVRAIKAVDSLRPDTNVKSWLFTILRNIWFNHLRRRRIAPKVVELDMEDGAQLSARNRDVAPAKGSIQTPVPSFRLGVNYMAIGATPGLLSRGARLLRKCWVRDRETHCAMARFERILRTGFPASIKVVSVILCSLWMTGTPEPWAENRAFAHITAERRKSSSFNGQGKAPTFRLSPGIGPTFPTTAAAAFSTEPVFKLQKAESGRNRVASGEYRIVAETKDGGIGPFAPGIHNFRESWTLWRLSDHSLEVEGERDYESPRGELHTNEFYLRLSSTFRIIGVKEFRKLRQRPDCGPLSCDFLPDALVCTAPSSDPSETLRWEMPVKEPYGYFWPISAFSLASITRSTNRDAVRGKNVQLVTLHEPNRAFPIFGTVIDGELRYLGHEHITIANRRWKADKFVLTVSIYSRFVVWIAPNGLLLAFGKDDGRTTSSTIWISLVSLQQYMAFEN